MSEQLSILADDFSNAYAVVSSGGTRGQVDVIRVRDGVTVAGPFDTPIEAGQWVIKNGR